MSQLLNECLSSKSGKSALIPLRENRSCFRIRNPEKLVVQVYEVDGCLLKKDSDGLRCDYLVLINSKDLEIFVELKGCDIDKAVKQLENSIRKLSCNVKYLDKECFIISTRSPKADTSTQKAKLSFKKKYNAKLTVKNRVFEYQI
ncbi:MAG: hypothetical protein AAGF93_21240 [Cyanobacteria bacterium P01_H01_bin.105]